MVMAAENTKSIDLAELYYEGNEEALERVISEYEVPVYNIAVHLTSDEASAREVVEEVFIRLYRDLPEYFTDSLESAIHQLAYEVALEKLLGRINKHVAEVDELVVNADGAASNFADTTRVTGYSNDRVNPADTLVFADCNLTKAALMLNDVTGQIRKTLM